MQEAVAIALLQLPWSTMVDGFYAGPTALSLGKHRALKMSSRLHHARCMLQVPSSC